MKSTSKIEIMWFEGKDGDWSNSQAEKFAKNYLDNGDMYEDMAHGNIFRFCFKAGDDRYSSVVLLPKFQYKLLMTYLGLNKIDLTGDEDTIEFYKEDEQKDYQEFYDEVFGKMISENLISKDIFEKEISLDWVSPDVGLHFEDNKFTGYSS